MSARYPILTAILGLVLLSACAPRPYVSPAAPPPAPLAPKDRLVAAIEADNCLLTADNVGTILLRANLTQEQLTAIVPELASEGRAEVAADGAIRVLTDRCI